MNPPFPSLFHPNLTPMSALQLQPQQMNRQRVGAPLLPMACGTWLSLPAVWPSLSASWTSCAPADDAQAAKPEIPRALLQTVDAWLAPIKAQMPAVLTPADTAAFGQAVTEEALARLQSLIAGVRAYHAAPARREPFAAARLVFEKGTTKLWDYAPGSDGPALLVVPSLVNRFDILDIAPDRSFLRFLAGVGFRPFVVDWDAPGPQEQRFSIADYLSQRLVPALEAVVALTEGVPVHLIGYCMGGLFALALAAGREAGRICSLTLLASPWDFAQGVGGVPGAATSLGDVFLRQARAWEGHLSQVGFVPTDFLQAMFTGFQPLDVLKKFMRFSQMDPSSPEASRFALVEDWLNDGVPLAYPVAMETLRDWYAGNLPGRLAWRIEGELIDPRKLAVPTYIVVADKDRIVPPESTLPLARLIQGAQLKRAALGHIGLMTSDTAAQDVWAPLAVWLARTEGARRAA